MLRCILAGLVSMAGCERFPFDWQPAEPASQAGAPQCVRDDDCALLPSALTCCIECPPAPPFEAVPTAVIAGLLIENETVCAEPKLCPEVRCDAVPLGCEARAACEQGRCVVVATGCDIVAASTPRISPSHGIRANAMRHMLAAAQGMRACAAP